MHIITFDSAPVLIKYSDRISYLPIFRTKSDADVAIADLRAEQPLRRYRVEDFSYELFDRWNEQFKSDGNMLFMYPVVIAEPHTLALRIDLADCLSHSTPPKILSTFKCVRESRSTSELFAEVGADAAPIVVR